MTSARMNELARSVKRANDSSAVPRSTLVAPWLSCPSAAEPFTPVAPSESRAHRTFVKGAAPTVGVYPRRMGSGSPGDGRDSIAAQRSRRAGVDPADRLLLECSRVTLDAAAADRVRTLLEGPLDWDTVLTRSVRHGVAPLLRR